MMRLKIKLTMLLKQSLSMNKYIIILIFTLYACKTIKPIVLTYEQNYPVIIRLSSKYKKVSRINLPIGIILENKSNNKQSFVSIDYLYTPYQEGIGEDIYSIKSDDNLLKVNNNKKKYLSSSAKKKYLVYSWYRIDSSKAIQKKFKTYIDKMLNNNKDTLHIGTVSEFKQKHKELFEKLTKNDSISIQFLEEKKLGERITVPVEW